MEPRLVVAQTGWLMMVATFGLWLDHTVFDSGTKTVIIRRRRFWVFASRRRIPFSDVAHIAYSLIDEGSVFGDERGYTERFDVALALHSGEEVPLFRFSGNGEFASEFSLTPQDWIQDRIHETFDVRGNQQERSLGIVDLLCARMEVPIGPSRYL